MAKSKTGRFSFLQMFDKEKENAVIASADNWLLRVFNVKDIYNPW
jgi:hypothetical protein